MSKRFVVEETIREDGLRVITKHLPYTKRARIAVSVLAGSAYDPAGKYGLFHYFEHMAFKGTKKRSVEELMAELERYSLSNNAFTARLETCYWGEGVYTHTEKLAEILFDMYLNPTFPREEFEKEKRVVKSEIARNKDSDHHTVLMALAERLWLQNPVRRFGAGEPEDIESITREILSEVHAKWYVASNTVVTAVGRVSHAEVLRQVNGAFPVSNLSVEHSVWDDEAGELPQEREVILTRPARNRSIVLLGCKIPQLTEPERLKLILLIRMLGSGMNSILFREVREKRGLVYTIGGKLDEEPKLANSLYFIAEALPEVTRDVRDLMREIVLGHPCDDKKHFELVRDTSRDRLLVGLESVDEWFNIIDNIMIGEGKSAGELARRIEMRRRNLLRVTLDDVLEIRRKLFQPDGFVSVVLQPE